MKKLLMIAVTLSLSAFLVGCSSENNRSYDTGSITTGGAFMAPVVGRGRRPLSVPAKLNERDGEKAAEQEHGGRVAEDQVRHPQSSEPVRSPGPPGDCASSSEAAAALAALSSRSHSMRYLIATSTAAKKSTAISVTKTV